MKSFHVLCAVLTIVLSGERVAHLLASNELVIFLIAGVLLFWHLASKRLSKDDSEKTDNSEKADKSQWKSTSAV